MINSKKTILISGISRGLGLAIAELALRNGYKVAGFSRSITDSIKKLKDREDVFLYKELDANNTQSIKEFVSNVEKKFGEIECLINNAAIGQDSLFTHTTDTNIEKIIATNISAPIIITKAVVRSMIKKGNPGSIINITSICGSKGFSGLTVYSATKGALEAFTRSLAVELGERKILVNCIAPGFFASELSSVLGDGEINTIKRRTPTKNLVKIDEIVKLIEFLLLHNSNITGQTLYVDGGLSI